MSGMMNMLVGAVAGGITPVVNTYTTSQTITAPAGAVQAVAELFGTTGAGGQPFIYGKLSNNTADGGSGACGGYAKSTIAITGGQTLVFTAGTPGTYPNGTGTASTLASGTKVIGTMTANGGGGGGDGSASIGGTGGTGGTASGGTDTNATGTAGNNGGVNAGFTTGPTMVGVNGSSNAGGTGGGTSGGTALAGTAGNGAKLVVQWS